MEKLSTERHSIHFSAPFGIQAETDCTYINVVRGHPHFYTKYNELPNLPIIKESQLQICIIVYCVYILCLYEFISFTGVIHGLVLIQIIYR
jgi:hypothetical protein